MQDPDLVAVEAAVRYLKSGFWPVRRFAELCELDGQYADWRDRTCNRRTHASGRFPVAERLAEERQALRSLPPSRFGWSGHRTSRVPIDGYLPLERQAANLLFALVSRRYERGSIIVTSNRGFEQWGEILGDAMVAAALIDRLVHHATMITLKGKSYRLRERGPGVTPAAQAPSLRSST